MSQQELVIDISPAGNVKIEANGFQGVGCAKATEEIEIALGGMGQKKKTPKPEYYMPEANPVHHHNGGSVF
jgi:hypothetical protein